jgi:hypothetical protein
MKDALTRFLTLACRPAADSEDIALAAMALADECKRPGEVADDVWMLVPKDMRAQVLDAFVTVFMMTVRDSE